MEVPLIHVVLSPSPGIHKTGVLQSWWCGAVGFWTTMATVCISKARTFFASGQ